MLRSVTAGLCSDTAHPAILNALNFMRSVWLTIWQGVFASGLAFSVGGKKNLGVILFVLF